MCVFHPIGTKEELGDRICEFLLAPEGEEEPAEDEEEEDAEEEDAKNDDEEDESASSEEDKKNKRRGAGGRGRPAAKDDKAGSRQSAGGRPRRSTVGRARGIYESQPLANICGLGKLCVNIVPPIRRHATSSLIVERNMFWFLFVRTTQFRHFPP